MRAATSASWPASLSLRHICGGAAILPHDGIVDRLAAGAVPYQRRLALVGDADRRDVARRKAGLGDGLAAGREHGAPEVLRIMLDPAGLREVLREFLLGDGRDRAIGAEHDGAGGGRALVDGEDVAGHRVFGSTVPKVHRYAARSPPTMPAMNCAMPTASSAVTARPSLLRRHSTSSAVCAHSTGHQVAQLGFRQCRTEREAEIGDGAGAVENGPRPCAIGRRKPFRMGRREERAIRPRVRR